MEPIIIRDMEQSYLVIQTGKDAIMGFQQKMLFNNQIRGVLTVEQRQIDAVSKYYYNVTDKISMYDYYAKKKKVSCSDVEFVFEKIMEIIQEAKEYLLEQDNFILRTDCIFFNLDGTKMYLCFYELYQERIRKQLVKLAEYFMETIDYKEERAVTLTYGLYKALRDENCSFGTIKEVINRYRIKMQPRERREDRIIPEPPYIQKEQIAEYKPWKRNTVIEKVFFAVCNLVFTLFVIKMRWIFYRNTNQVNVSRLLVMGLFLVILNAILSYGIWYIRKKNDSERELTDKVECESIQNDGEGTIVIPNYIIQYALRKEGAIEQIRLFSFPFILGSNQKSVDCTLPYEGVSKRHAVIDNKDAKYHIMDLGSTNGTFLNGELLNPMESYELKLGDKITIANHTYDFIKI